MGKRLHLNVEEIERLYTNDRKTITEIAKVFRVDNSTISTRLKERKVKLRKLLTKNEKIKRKKESDKKYRNKNIEKARKYGKKWRLENIDGIKHYRIINKDKIKNNRKRWTKKNKGYNKKYNNMKIVKDRKKRWYNKNIDRMKIRRHNYYIENRERSSILCREWAAKNVNRRRELALRHYHKRYNKDIPYTLRLKLSKRLNMAISKYNKYGKVTKSKNVHIDYRSIINHLKPFPENIKDYHIDHIIPLSVFDLTNEKHIKKTMNPVNLQWLKIADNLSKRNIVNFHKYPQQKEVYSSLKLGELGIKIKNE